MSTLIIHIKSLCGIGNKNILRGDEMGIVNQISNAWLLIENGLISDFGEMQNAPQRADEIIDASGKFVLPSWCDSHTHLVFATTREEEFRMRLMGKTYEEIAAVGGGILNSAAKLRSMSEGELFDGAMMRIDEIKKTGTGAVEIKSGYGLTVDAEIKMLRVIRKLKEHSGLIVKATFLGAHAIPLEYKNNRSRYIDLIIYEMLPKINDEGLADFADVFCEQGYFTNDETDRILQAGAKYNLKPKIHVNQFSNSGGVQTGIRNHALTVDHLEYLGEEEINALLKSSTIPASLPSCSFFINIPYTPARKIIDAGLPLALASDFNPGTSPSGNIPFVMSLACTQMKMTPEEAINAVTINGAAAMEIENLAGSITIGKKANLIITKKINSLAMIPYSYGENLIEQTILS